MNANDREKYFLGKVKDLLNEGMENLDSQTRLRLEHVRIRALRSAAEKRSRFFTPQRWIMVGGFATATMAAMVLFFWLHTSPGVLPAKHFEDFEIITSKEQTDFYQNLDFYRWLATNEDYPAQGKTS